MLHRVTNALSQICNERATVRRLAIVWTTR
jgi:hypothetical protein